MVVIDDQLPKAIGHLFETACGIVRVTDDVSILVSSFGPVAGWVVFKPEPLAAGIIDARALN